MFDFFKKKKNEEVTGEVEETLRDEQVTDEEQDTVDTATEQESGENTVDALEETENTVPDDGSAEDNVSEDIQTDNVVEDVVPVEKEKGFFARLKEGLTKTRNSINESFNQLFSGFSSIDEDFYDELEETLIMADLGLDTTERIIDNLKDMVKKNHIKEVEACRELVINIIKEQMLVEDSAYDFENQKTVMLIIGVNGDHLPR